MFGGPINLLRISTRSSSEEMLRGKSLQIPAAFRLEGLMETQGYFGSGKYTSLTPPAF